ncbi:hypothetical protein V5E97_27770 [Singulisphaera sp. Ch08]|uniref:Uncharacterized protein n=1 Tax=Singulisphaera sp. Ch08 TaxID=3120278 RepID=A0AAU7C9Y0_9BACT
MALPERFLFGFAYHRVGATNLWRPSGSTLRRADPDQRGAGPEAVLALKTEQIVWIDVLAEEKAGQDIDDLALSCEVNANAEFRRLFPNVELADPPKLG